jgi:hypothetical protein
MLMTSAIALECLQSLNHGFDPAASLFVACQQACAFVRQLFLAVAQAAVFFAQAVHVVEQPIKLLAQGGKLVLGGIGCGHAANYIRTLEEICGPDGLEMSVH